jgi:iron complex transport system substrate-binding protein
LPWVLLAVLLAAVGLAACGDDEAADADADADAGAVTDASTPTSDSFPVTIEHKFGETTIEEEPERVVAVGWNDQEAVLALGVTPVGMRDWFEEYPELPWVAERLDGAEVQLVGSEVDPESVVAMEPDLILAIYDTVDQDTYDTYSAIAPTVVQSDEFADEETPWQEQTLLTGQALGRSEQAEALVDELEAELAEAREENPDFADLTLVANFYPDFVAGEHWLLADGDPRRSLFDALGFQAQEERDAVSLEQSSLLDRDVLVVNGASEEEWAEQPVVADLGVVTEGRTVFVPDDSEVSAALAYGSVLSIEHALHELLPQLRDAADAAA